MRKLMRILVLLLMVSGMCYAQQGGGLRREKMARIHAAKMAYITDRLQLNAKQSADFVPLYNEYEGEVRTIRKGYLGKYKNQSAVDMDDAAARAFVDDNLDYQQEVINLKRKYNDRFLKVLSAQQLAELNKAEREFREMLKKRLEERKSKL